jgi:uncharacterized protein (TIGR03067 family)
VQGKKEEECKTIAVLKPRTPYRAALLDRQDNRSLPSVVYLSTPAEETLMPHLLLPFAVVSLAFAPLPFPKPDTAKADLGKMQGEWRCVSCILSGKPRDLVAHPITVTVKGDQMGFGTPDDTWRLVLDVKPGLRRIDFVRVKSLDGTDLIRGVYRLDGDTLTFCWRMGKDEKDRPTSLDPAQPEVWVYAFKRHKP